MHVHSKFSFLSNDIKFSLNMSCFIAPLLLLLFIYVSLYCPKYRLQRSSFMSWCSHHMLHCFTNNAPFFKHDDLTFAKNKLKNRFFLGLTKVDRSKEFSFYKMLLILRFFFLNQRSFAWGVGMKVITVRFICILLFLLLSSYPATLFTWLLTLILPPSSLVRERGSNFMHGKSGQEWLVCDSMNFPPAYHQINDSDNGRFVFSFKCCF